MQLDFRNRNIIVLGSSDGIGLQVALQLAQNNANACIVGRDIAKLEAAYAKINEISRKNHQNIYVNCDLTNPNSVNEIWSQVTAKWNGKVDSIVLNAGGPPFVKNSVDVPILDWHTYFQSLFLSQITLVSKCIDSMKANGFGRIVSISSSTIIEPAPGLVISSAIRSALAAWLKTLANEVAIHGITVTTVPIGKVATKRLEKLDSVRAETNSSSIQEVINANSANIPVGRYGTVEEAANVITFLLSEYSSYINGSLVHIDGGSMKKCL
ncbi:MAG: NADH(P)-binding family protein [Burkholderiales bacterium]|jgi:3-oxoacyl-[acyl-carrier protein] reductase|nr:NADH(P)-binding family protein [Burkholderiales bacterium]